MQQGIRGIAFAGGESFAIQELPTALFPLSHLSFIRFNKHAHLPLWVLIPSIPGCKAVENSYKWTKETRCWGQHFDFYMCWTATYCALLTNTITIIDIHLSTLYMTACILLYIMHNWLFALDVHWPFWGAIDLTGVVTKGVDWING